MSSLPVQALSGQVASAVAVPNPIDVLFAGVNSSPYFTGLMMLLLNLGGRFLALEISKEQEKFLSQPMVRRFFLFAVLFVATRNVIIAAGLAVLVILVLGYLFNENSDLCLFKSCAVPVKKEEAPVQEGFVGLSAEEAMILKRLQDKQMAAKQAQQGDQEATAAAVVAPPPMASQIYATTLAKIRGLF